MYYVFYLSIQSGAAYANSRFAIYFICWVPHIHLVLPCVLKPLKAGYLVTEFIYVKISILIGNEILWLKEHWPLVLICSPVCCSLSHFQNFNPRRTERLDSDDDVSICCRCATSYRRCSSARDDCVFGLTKRVVELLPICQVVNSNK